MTKSCLYTDHASSGRLPEVKKKQIIKPPSKKWSPQSLIRDVRLQHLTLTGKIFLLGGWSVLGGGRVVTNFLALLHLSLKRKSYYICLSFRRNSEETSVYCKLKYKRKTVC